MHPEAQSTQGEVEPTQAWNWGWRVREKKDCETLNRLIPNLAGLKRD